MRFVRAQLGIYVSRRYALFERFIVPRQRLTNIIGCWGWTVAFDVTGLFTASLRAGACWMCVIASVYLIGLC